MMTFVIVKNNVDEMVAIEAIKAGNRVIYGTYEASDSKDALNKHFAKSGVKPKSDKTIQTKSNVNPVKKLNESSSRMLLLHLAHFLALFGVNLHQQVKVSGTYFTSSSTSWEFLINPAGIIAVLISWAACSMIGSILKRVTMIYNSSLE